MGASAPFGPAEEAAVGIGAGELERLDLAAEVALPAAQVVVEVAVDHRSGMHHESPPDQARGVGEAVGRARVGRQQQEAGGADAVGCAQHDVGSLEVLAPVGVEPRRARATAASVDLDATHARAPVTSARRRRRHRASG